MKVVGKDDPDLGMCDWCQSDEGVRRQTSVRGQFNGEPCLVRMWLCGPCAKDRREASRVA